MSETSPYVHVEICASGLNKLKERGKKRAESPTYASPSSRVGLNMLVDSNQDYQRD